MKLPYRNTLAVSALTSFLTLTGSKMIFVVAHGDEDHVHSSCTNGVPLPSEFNEDEWPDLFRLDNPDPIDPTATNFDLGGNMTMMDPAVLARAGVIYRYIDPTGFDYPNATASVSWSPPVDGINDPLVQELREVHNYQYADIIVVTDFIPKFWDEHLHDAPTIRYMLDGSGYFDLRDLNDKWVRIPVSAGDWFEWPAGTYHRFTVDEAYYTQAMRLYKGSASPEWSAVPRWEVLGNNTARKAYVNTYLCGIDPDLFSADSNEVEDHGDDGLSLDDSRCSAHSECAAIGLDGACCPSTRDVILECCNKFVDPSSSVQQVAPASGLLTPAMAVVFCVVVGAIAQYDARIELEGQQAGFCSMLSQRKASEQNGEQKLILR